MLVLYCVPLSYTSCCVYLIVLAFSDLELLIPMINILDILLDQPIPRLLILQD